MKKFFFGSVLFCSALLFLGKGYAQFDLGGVVDDFFHRGGNYVEDEIDDFFDDIFGEGHGGPMPDGSFTLPAPGEFNEIGQNTSLRQYILNVVNFALSFLGLIAVVAVIYAGYLYVANFGNDGQQEKAKKIITYAILGIFVVLVSYALVKTIITHAPVGGSDRGELGEGGIAPGEGIDVGLENTLGLPGGTVNNLGLAGNQGLVVEGAGIEDSILAQDVYASLASAQQGLSFSFAGFQGQGIIYYGETGAAPEQFDTESGMNLSHTYLQPGSYRVQWGAITSDGQTLRYTKNVHVVSLQPVISILPTTVSVGESVRVSAQKSTIVPQIPVKTYNWSCSGGEGCFDSVPTTASGFDATFIAPGTYTISLELVGTGGVSGQASQTITITGEREERRSGERAGEVQAEISAPSNIKRGETVTLSAQSSKATSYAWEMPNGTKLNGKQVRYAFPTAGKQTVKLTVSDGKNSGLVRKSVVVENVGKPTAVPKVIVDGVEQTGSQVQISRQSGISISSESIQPEGGSGKLEESWLVDGKVVNKSQLPGELKDLGAHTVKLVVFDEDDSNIRDEEIINVQVVNIPPVVAGLTFQKDQTLGAARVRVRVQASDSDGQVEKYKFEAVRQGVAIATQSVSMPQTDFNLNLAPGEAQYSFRVTVEDNDGGTTTYTSPQALQVQSDVKNTPPQANITVQPSNRGLTSTNFSFYAEVSDVDRDALTYTWTLPGGIKVNETFLSRRFETPGSYAIGLEVSDGIATTSTSLTITVEADLNMPTGGTTASGSTTPNISPVIDSLGISPRNTGNVDTVFSFYGKGSDEDDTLLSYSWDMGDRSTPQNLKNVSYRYETPGTYNVVLTVSDGKEKVTASVPVTVVAKDEPIPRSTVEAHVPNTDARALQPDEISISSGSSASELAGEATGIDAQIQGYSDLRGTTNTTFFLYGLGPKDIDRALYFEWDMGNGTKKVGQNVSMRYPTPGRYTITLSVSDGLTTASDSLLIEVSAP